MRSIPEGTREVKLEQLRFLLYPTQSRITPHLLLCLPYEDLESCRLLDLPLFQCIIIPTVSTFF